jgi:hypothetical protein
MLPSSLFVRIKSDFHPPAVLSAMAAWWYLLQSQKTGF